MPFRQLIYNIYSGCSSPLEVRVTVTDTIYLYIKSALKRCLCGRLLEMSRPVHQVPHLPFGRLAGFAEVGVDLPRGTNLHAVRIESSGCHSYSTRTTRRAKAERLDSMIRSHPEDFGGPPLGDPCSCDAHRSKNLHEGFWGRWNGLLRMKTCMPAASPATNKFVFFQVVFHIPKRLQDEKRRPSDPHGETLPWRRVSDHYPSMDSPYG